MSDNETEVSMNDINEERLRELYKLAAGNAQDIHHIRMTLREITSDNETSTVEEGDLEPLRVFLHEEAPPISGVSDEQQDTLDYFFEQGGIDPEDVENINTIKEENRRLKQEVASLRSRLLELIDPNELDGNNDLLTDNKL
ncbi:hypothetical protein G6M89_09145 [Natronolimnobius sp. AArcel1]|uniref:hypothetical protein n=1 Tax=Natronolimnobius sp. AArcel1 TaxID=1679093 RepID=UPI0013ED32C8|nr:hypothetical protein [Natronolimnobius sp. AArcel1]NGM69169.1 hypothetical protein [Natronolimnobius sp. AArcel1]